MDRSICSSAGHHARISPSQENVPDSMENVQVSPSTLFALLTNSDANGSYGKTSPAHSVPIKGEISQDYYPSLPDARLESPNRDLIQPDLFALFDGTDTEWHGECWTLALSGRPDSLGASLSDAADSSLSDILETGPVPPKYSLTMKARKGILRRSDRRGRPLPPILKEAIQSGGTDPNSPAPSREPVPSRECRTKEDFRLS